MTNDTRTDKQWLAALIEALTAADLPRQRALQNWELRGWTRNLGSTDFSLRLTDQGQVSWHFIISGKPHLKYEPYYDRHTGDKRHEPIEPERLSSRIQAVFEDLGLTVHEVAVSGWSHTGDDDVAYSVLTDFPPNLSRT